MSGWPTPDNRYNEAERELARLDPAFANFALALRTGVRFGHAEGELLARSLPAVVAELDVHRSAYEGGDKVSLLAAVAVCARECLPLPSWAALALLARLRDYEDGKLWSLDTVFGSPLPTGNRGLRERRDRQLGARLRVHVAYAQSVLGTTNFDAALRYAIKECRTAVGRTKARALVLADEARQRRFYKPAVRTFSQWKRKTRNTTT